MFYLITRCIEKIVFEEEGVRFVKNLLSEGSLKRIEVKEFCDKFVTQHFSVDHIKMGLYRSNRNCGFTPFDSNEAIAKKLWPLTREMIKTIMKNNQNIIIEGCYLLPELVKGLEEKYSNQIISVFLGFSTNYIEENFTSNIIKHRNVIETRNYLEE